MPKSLLAGEGGLMHFKLLWPSLDLSQPAISGLALHITRAYKCRNTHMALLYALTKKVYWQNGVNEVWFGGKSLCDVLCLCFRHRREIMHIFSCSLQIHKCVRLSSFPSAPGHGLSVMTFSIKLCRLSVSWLEVTPAALDFIMCFHQVVQ